jgi:hypothetical protein
MGSCAFYLQLPLLFAMEVSASKTSKALTVVVLPVLQAM